MYSEARMRCQRPHARRARPTRGGCRHFKCLLQMLLCIQRKLDHALQQLPAVESREIGKDKLLGKRRQGRERLSFRALRYDHELCRNRCRSGDLLSVFFQSLQMKDDGFFHVRKSRIQGRTRRNAPRKLRRIRGKVVLAFFYDDGEMTRFSHRSNQPV